MAGVKISALPTVASSLLTDFFPAVQGGITSKETLQQVFNLFIATYFPVSGANGGTGVANTGKTITIGGNVAFSGAFTFAGTVTGNTAVTFPTSGTLATTSQLPTLPLSGANGGTGVANTGSTITIGGNVAFSGAHSFTGTLTADTSVTFPTSGTLATVGQVTTWNNISGTTQAAAVNNSYIVGNAGQTTITLPATAALGSIIAVQGKGAAGWILVANGGQTIQLGSSATSSGGSLTSANQWDSIEVVCVTANTTWATRFALSSGLTVA